MSTYWYDQDPSYYNPEGQPVEEPKWLQTNRSRITYMSLEDATREPGDGFWDILVDRWWSYNPEKGLLFYAKSPQCNKHESIARTITSKYHPEAQVLFVPRVYLRHDCADYR